MKTDRIYEELTKIVGFENVFLNESMKKHTSIRVGGNADFFVRADQVEKIRKICQLSKETKTPLTILGNGTNVLVQDHGIRGIVLKMDIRTVEVQKSEDKLTIKAGAGVPLIKLSKLAGENAATGLEFAIGIPGSLGGAIKMNAGAYGSEMDQVVKKTTYMDRDGKIQTLGNTEQAFGYRKSIFFENDWIILESTLELPFGNPDEIQKKMQDNLMSRQAKQPLDKPSCGSTFKRGEDFVTAQLIDACGLKGLSVGDAVVSTKHAGFVMNNGNATAEDFMKLTDQVKTEVYKKFHKNIELEVEVMGEK